jgi:predicted nucleotidyltransferase
MTRAVADLRRELAMTATLHEILQEFRDGLERIYGQRLAGLILFGSQARGEASPDSDIDVMVVLRGSVNPHEEIHRLSAFKSQLCLKYDVVISCVYVSEAEYRHGESPLMLNVRREGVPV